MSGIMQLGKGAMQLLGAGAEAVAPVMDKAALLGLGASTVSLGASVAGDPLLEGAAESMGGRTDAMVRGTLDGLQARARVQNKLERDRRARKIATDRLAVARPDLYNSILAGRELPEGATVIGGDPDSPLMAKVADMMVNGGFR